MFPFKFLGAILLADELVCCSLIGWLDQLGRSGSKDSVCRDGNEVFNKLENTHTHKKQQAQRFNKNIV